MTIKAAIREFLRMVAFVHLNPPPNTTSSCPVAHATIPTKEREKMIESRCGILCSQCPHIGTCGGGCTNITKPFWGDACPVKDCCEGRGYKHCGQCTIFPCPLLTQFAYHTGEGDNGQRIQNCRKWAGKTADEVIDFPVGHFIQAVTTQNAEALTSFFEPDAKIYWHDSNEQFTVPEYIQANCKYPGNWTSEIVRVEKIEDGAAIVTKLVSDESTHLVTAFAKLAKGKITRLDEYYSDCNEAPAWRKEMKIGKPIV